MIANLPNPLIPLVKVAMPPRDQLMPALEEVLYSGMIAEGEYVYNFERRFAEQFALSNVLAFNSGTAALHIALLLAGAAPGREVITTSMTAEPTNTTILQTGARPVFADIDSSTGNLCPQMVEAAVTTRTVAIVVVHYAGYPADLDALRAIADRNGIALVEDCAHALGAHYRGQPVGSFGDSAIFSFQAIKHMTTIDGGMLILRDSNQVAEARRLRWFGLTKGVPRTEIDIVRPGFKYNMHNVAAVIGLTQLEHIKPRLESHRLNGAFFDANLAAVPGLEPARIVDCAAPSYWIYTLLTDDSDSVEKCLAAAGVSASKLHRPNHFHTAFAPFAGDMPGLDRFYRRLIHLPCGWWVDGETRLRIVDCLIKG